MSSCKDFIRISEKEDRVRITYKSLNNEISITALLSNHWKIHQCNCVVNLKIFCFNFFLKWNFTAWLKKTKFLSIEKYIIKHKKKWCLTKNIKHKGFVLKKLRMRDKIWILNTSNICRNRPGKRYDTYHIPGLFLVVVFPLI